MKFKYNKGDIVVYPSGNKYIIKEIFESTHGYYNIVLHQRNTDVETSEYEIGYPYADSKIIDELTILDKSVQREEIINKILNGKV